MKLSQRLVELTLTLSRNKDDQQDDKPAADETYSNTAGLDKWTLNRNKHNRSDSLRDFDLDDSDLDDDNREDTDRKEKDRDNTHNSDEEKNSPKQKKEDPNKQGLIRKVEGAHLVYKREQPDGTYQEMWVFNSKDLDSDIKLKRQILAGTDIPPNSTVSADGMQRVDIWTVGNGVVMVISGLPQ